MAAPEEAPVMADAQCHDPLRDVGRMRQLLRSGPGGTTAAPTPQGEWTP